MDQAKINRVKTKIVKIKSAGVRSYLPIFTMWNMMVALVWFLGQSLINKGEKKIKAVRITCTRSVFKRLLDTTHRVKFGGKKCVPKHPSEIRLKSVEVKTKVGIAMRNRLLTQHMHSHTTMINLSQTTIFTQHEPKMKRNVWLTDEANINTPFRGMWRNIWQRNCTQSCVLLCIIFRYFVSKVRACERERERGGAIGSHEWRSVC